VDEKNDVAGAVEFTILLITELGKLESDSHIDYDIAASFARVRYN
jgi:hypothetical protein